MLRIPSIISYQKNIRIKTHKPKLAPLKPITENKYVENLIFPNNNNMKIRPPLFFYITAEHTALSGHHRAYHHLHRMPPELLVASFASPPRCSHHAGLFLHTRPVPYRWAGLRSLEVAQSPASCNDLGSVTRGSQQWNEYTVCPSWMASDT